MQTSTEATTAAPTHPSAPALATVRVLAGDLLATLVQTDLAFDGVRMLLQSPESLGDFVEAFRAVGEHPTIAGADGGTAAGVARDAVKWCLDVAAGFDLLAAGVASVQGVQRSEKYARNELARCARVAVDARLVAMLGSYGCATAAYVVGCGLHHTPDAINAVGADVARFSKSAARAVLGFLAHHERPLDVLRAVRVWSETADLVATLRVLA